MACISLRGIYVFLRSSFTRNPGFHSLFSFVGMLYESSFDCIKARRILSFGSRALLAWLMDRWKYSTPEYNLVLRLSLWIEHIRCRFTAPMQVMK